MCFNKQEDINAAVAAAKRAFHRNSEWRQMDASKRGRILYKFADLVERDAEYLAELETHNNGMVLSMCKHFVGSSANHIRYNASLADKIQGSTIPSGMSSILIHFNIVKVRGT